MNVFLIVWAIIVTAFASTVYAIPSDAVFPIMPWDSTRDWDEPADGHKNGIDSMAECGFTISAFCVGDDLSLIKKVGMKAMIHPPAGWHGKLWKGSPEEVDSIVKNWVTPTAANSTVFGYMVTDEPSARDFTALSRVVAAIRKHAPGKVAYINLFPGYATIGATDKSQLGAASFDEYLERFVNEVKPFILSYDDYQVIYSDDLQSQELGAIYFKDLIDVRAKAEQHKLPWWNTICSNRIRANTVPPSPANLMLQAYTSLAAGAKGISWYTYYSHGYENAPINKEGNRSDTWAYLQMTNRQIKTLGKITMDLKSTGLYFTTPTPADGLPKLPGRVIKAVTSRASLNGYGKVEPPVMAGEFSASDGCDYVMLVNLSLTHSANIRFATNKAYRKLEVYSSQDGTLHPLDTSNGHWLTAGQGALIKLSTE